MASSLFPEVVVNGVTIPQAEIAAETQNHPVSAFKPGWAWKAAARALVLRELLRQEIARLGIEAEPRALGAGKWESEEEASIRCLLDRALQVAAPSEDALKAAYERAPERYRSPHLFEASHILFGAAAEDREARAAARRKAEAALAILQRDPAAFAELARSQSDCGSAAEGGRLGQIAEGGALPEFESLLTRLRPGEIAPEPVETRFGLHVVRLDARAESQRLPFESVRSQIAEAAERTAWARAAKIYVAQLIAAAEIEGIAFEAGGAPPPGAVSP